MGPLGFPHGNFHLGPKRSPKRSPPSGVLQVLSPKEYPPRGVQVGTPMGFQMGPPCVLEGVPQNGVP